MNRAKILGKIWGNKNFIRKWKVWELPQGGDTATIFVHLDNVWNKTLHYLSNNKSKNNRQ